MLHARKSYVTVARIRNKIEESRVRVMLASYVRKVHIAHYNTSHFHLTHRYTMMHQAFTHANVQITCKTHVTTSLSPLWVCRVKGGL